MNQIDTIVEYMGGNSVQLSIDTLNTYLKAISVVANDAKLNFTQDGVRCRVVDFATVLLGDLYLDIPTDIEGAYGVNVSELYQMIKGIKAKEANISFEDGFLRLTVDSRRYKLRLIDASTIKEPKIPNFQFDAGTEVNAYDLAESIKAMLPLEHGITFTIDEGLRLSCSAANQNEIEEFFEVVTDGKAKTMFSNEYLSLIAPILSKGELCTIKMKTGYPIELTTNIENLIDVKYILAPTIEE